MTLSVEVEEQLRLFVKQSAFSERGGVVTDLDGTAVHEHQGRIVIPQSVELGLKQLFDLGRPLVLNSLRFPLSVIRTFGRDWYNVSNKPVPTVTLNGSLLGYVTRTPEDEIAFEEIAAFPLSAAEIDEALAGVAAIVAGGIKDVLVFYYPRDWRVGEVIWTPVPEMVIPVKEKYASASSVTAVEFPKLRDQMLAEDICMIFLLINADEDQLMAYQHTKRSNFITTQGVDKLTGSRSMAAALGFDLAHSLGAGDTELDRFLDGVGLSVHVGPINLDFRGLTATIKIRDSHELGELLFRAAELQREMMS